MYNLSNGRLFNVINTSIGKKFLRSILHWYLYLLVMSYSLKSYETSNQKKNNAYVFL